MSRRTERIVLPSAGIGSERFLTLHHYGDAEATPKAYLQASIHADEIPAMMALHHLLQRLEAADSKGEISGEITVVPYANPIGLSQFVNRRHLGRYALDGSGNFNRNWPDLTETVASAVEGKLGADEEANRVLIRAAMAEAFEAMHADSQLAALRQILGREAARADIVLDVHCDNESLLHLFIVPELWPQAEDLAIELESPVTFLAPPSGGNPFDEVWSSLWVDLIARFPDHPIPLGCLSYTVELRGTADVSDALGAKDANGLFRFLQRRGLIAGDPGPVSDFKTQASPWSAVDLVTAPAPGVLAYQVELGSRVEPGQVIAELIDPAAENPMRARRPIKCQGGGLVFARRLDRYVLPGMAVAKIAGLEPLAHRTGYLMLD